MKACKERAEQFKKRIYPLSQKELADWIGVSRVIVSNWMTAKIPIKKVYWVATSRVNMVEYIKSNPSVKNRLIEEAQYKSSAMDLVKEVLR